MPCMTSRIAITLRLSRADDDSTSFAVQERACRLALAAAGLTGEIKVFEDYGVSGASPLDQREGMTELRAWGPTHVIAWKLDRYARSVAEFLALVAWADDNGATLLTADGTLNTGTPTGRMIAVILVALAAWERDMIVSRVTEAHAERRAQGRWISGKPPWPYALESRASGKFLVEDPGAFAMAREAVDDLLSGGNMTSTARTLPIGMDQWRRLLRGPILLGFREYDGAIVTDSDGVTPTRFGPEVIDAATHARVQARIAELGMGDEIQRPDSPWLSGMVRCACGSPMDGSKGRKGQPLYNCRRRDATVLARLVHPVVEDAFLDAYGDTPLVHVTYEGGVDNSAEMAALDAQRDRIGAALAAVDGPVIESLSARLDALEARYSELRAAHDPEPREIRTPTGHNLYDAWEGSTAEGQRRLLSGHGLRVTIHPAGTPGGRVSVSWDDDPS